MNRNNWLIGGLVVAVVLLVGTLMFLVGRTTAPPDSGRTTPANSLANVNSGPPGASGVSKTGASERSQENGTIMEPAGAIPEPFRGEWNEDLADCGTGNNDTRLRVAANLVDFYESDGEVRRVTRHNSRAITVEMSVTGEGQTWDDTRRMVLSRSGADLTIEGFTRHRCP